MQQSCTYRGFVLQSSYKLEAGRPLLLLSGRLETGQSFVLRESRQIPHFYMKEADAERIPKTMPVEIVPSNRTTLKGEATCKLQFATPKDADPLRASLNGRGIPTYEADVRFPQRYLIEHGIRGSLRITAAPGQMRKGSGDLAGFDLVFDDPQIAPDSFKPNLSTLSLDIETDPSATHILSIALYGLADQGGAPTVDQAFLVAQRGVPCPKNTTLCADEAALLRAFAAQVRKLDPDVLIGWNVIDFDLAVLDRAAQRLQVPLHLGRQPGSMRLQSSPSRADIPGRVVLDGIALLRGAFIQLEEYSLDAVARKILGEGKTLTGDHRAESILDLYNTDLQRFVEYNRTDARLAYQILERLGLVALSVERSLLTGMTPDRVSASIASFDLLYLSELAARGFVGPTLTEESNSAPTEGGYVLAPEPGLYEYVLVFDFKSLYPSLIRTFQIDPLGALGPQEIPAYKRQNPLGPIYAPNGAAFRREPGILPQILDRLFPEREEAKRAGNAVKSQAIKILMNSFYGVLGTSACRFHDASLANAITGFGQSMLLYAKSCIEEHGYRVRYGDTDSLFVESGATSREEALHKGEALCRQINAQVSAYILERYGLQSQLELEFESLYLKLFLPRVRGAEEGARKRYVGLLAGTGPEEDRVVFTGMEVVRRDWTELAKEVQRQLYERLFRLDPAEPSIRSYLKDKVQALRLGHLESSLIYRKGLRKQLGDYTATTPPHVAAARKLGGKPSRLVSYVITKQGPEPATLRESPIDHEHYVQKQIRPVAEPVLHHLGLDFDEIIGDKRQLEFAF